MSNLENVITDAVNDAQISDEPVDTSSTDTTQVEDASPTVEAQVETPTDEHAQQDTPETPSEPITAPTEGAPTSMKDHFEQLAGVPQMGIGGRENRIPYSRVKKITEKAVNDIAEVALGRKLNTGEKATDVVKAHVARIPQLEASIKDYESKLDTVGQFEEVMAKDPDKFFELLHTVPTYADPRTVLQSLSKLPAYKPFFDFVEQSYAAANGMQQPSQQVEQTQSVTGDDPMPEPDETLADGSKVFSLDGIKSLLAWNSRQTESRVASQLGSQYAKRFEEMESRYAPIEQQWRAQQHRESVRPVIQAQIAEAYTWPLFKENEVEITELLEKDPNISLEAAYRKAVFPKLVAERNTMRQNVLQEVKNAPTATSVGMRVATKPNTTPTGPRSLEDIIRESVENNR